MSERYQLTEQVQKIVRCNVNWIVTPNEQYVQASELENIAIWIDDETAEKIIALVRADMARQLLSDDAVKAAALGGIEAQGPITWYLPETPTKYGNFDSDDWEILAEAMTLAQLAAIGITESEVTA